MTCLVLHPPPLALPCPAHPVRRPARSGPFRYDHQPGGRWVYHRDGRDLVKQLQQELKGLLGQAPALEHL